MLEQQPASLVDQVWFTTREAAAYARCSVDTILRAVWEGALQSSQAGVKGWHRFRREWIDNWLENRHRLPRPKVQDGRAPRRSA